MKPANEILDQDIYNIAKKRLLLADLEKELFGNNLNIPFEIMLFVGANSGRSILADVYNNINSTDAAVRLNIRALEGKGLITSHLNESDSRSKFLCLTTSGMYALKEYYLGLNRNFVSKRTNAEGNS
jgi:DNA-binding MarR family transcriptional regulator